MHRIEVYTARMRYGGTDRFDITVKSGHKAFAPSWDIVMGVKNGTVTEKQYLDRYITMMHNSFMNNRSAWVELLSKDIVTLVCFCPRGTFCHRYALVDILIVFGRELGVEVVYRGERE